MAELPSQSSKTPLTDSERLERRSQIAALEAHMLAMPAEEQVGIAGMTSHIFGGGVYCRRMDIPAGVVVVGKIHKTEHISILLSGSVQITTEEGTSEPLHAPQIVVAQPGTKRIAKALTDCTWLALHAVGAERDLAKIEAQFIAPSFEALEAEQRREIA